MRKGKDTAEHSRSKRLAAVRDRLATVMGWPTGSVSHKFEIMRQVLTGKAIALGVDKAEQIADRLEYDDARWCRMFEKKHDPCLQDRLEDNA